MGWGQPWVKGPVGTLEWVVRKGLNPAEAGRGAAGVLGCVWHWEDDFILLPDLVLSCFEPDILHICQSMKSPGPAQHPS